MGTDGLVSVVVAAYNAERFLAKALRSALAQTYGHLEVVVVDDGSTDGTREVVREFLGDSRVRYVWQANGGQPSAENRGIRESRGRFVAFLDSDDLWMPRKLEKQIPLFAEAPRVGVVYSPTVYIDEQDEPQPAWPIPRYTGRITEQLLIRNFVPFDSCVVRRECFDAVGLFDESLVQASDWDLWLRLSTRYEFAMVEEPTVYYRVWPGQMSRNFRLRYDCALRILRRFLAEHGSALDRRVVREAWADAYVGRGYHVRKFERSRVRAAADFLRALSHCPTYLPAWRSLAEAVLR